MLHQMKATIWKHHTFILMYVSKDSVNPVTVNGKIQGLFKAFECYSSSFQGKFNFQRLFKTVLDLYIQVLFKPVQSLSIYKSIQDPMLVTALTYMEPQASTCWYKCYEDTVKPVQIGHSKIDKTKILMTNGSLLKVKSIAECSSWAFCNTFDLYKVIIGLENQFSIFLKWLIYTGFTVVINQLLFIQSETYEFQQCGLCGQQSLRSACAYAQFGVSKLKRRLHQLVWVYSWLVQMPRCWKLHVLLVRCDGSFVLGWRKNGCPLFPSFQVNHFFKKFLYTP